MALKNRETFGSRMGMLLAMAGSAIGLGNIWRFPYMMGKNGGAAALTDTCREVIRRYKELEASVREYARAEYEKIFGNMIFRE